MLAPWQFPGAFASTLLCGERRVTIGYIDDRVRLSDGAGVFDLVAAPGAPPHRFVLPGDPTTFVALDEHSATVSVRGQVYPRCLPVR